MTLRLLAATFVVASSLVFASLAQPVRPIPPPGIENRHQVHQGLDRARELREGKPSWIHRTGLVVRGYVSRIDGSSTPRIRTIRVIGVLPQKEVRG